MVSFMKETSRRLIVLVGADNGRYLTSLAHGFRLDGMKVLRFSPPPPTSGVSSGDREQTKSSQLKWETIRLAYSFRTLRKIGSSLFTIFAEITIRVMRRRIFLMIVNSPGNQHRRLLRSANSLGVKVVSGFHGSDLRPPFLNGLFIAKNNPAGLLRQHHSIRSIAALAEEASEYCIAWSKTGHYFERPYVCHESLGFPIPPVVSTTPTSERLPQGHDKPRQPLRILHAPSSSGKGTSEIRSIIMGMKERGLAVEFEVVQSLQSPVLFARILEADLVIDQIFAGSAPSVLALECLMLRVPVVTGGWSLGDLGTRFPQLNSLASVTPHFFESTLTDLVSSRHSYLAMAQSQRELADHLFEDWSAVSVTRRIFDSIAEPSTVEKYKVERPPGLALGGFGPEDQIRTALNEYIERFGARELGLDHNQPLLNQLIEWS